MRKKLFGSRDTQAMSADMLNRYTYYYYFYRLQELAISCFDWVNLPPEIDTRFLELNLFKNGEMLFFRDNDLGEYLTLPFNSNGKLDHYGRPKQRHTYAVNGYSNDLNNRDSVIIYNNMLHRPCYTDLQLFAERLTNITRSIDVNVNAQKTPVLLQACDQSQRLTLKNLYMQYDGNEPFIFADKKLTELNKITSINTQAPFVSKELEDLKQRVWGEVLTYLGIENVSTEKRERLITDEVIQNSGATFANRESRLKTRKQACIEINKMFNLNVDVNFSDVKTFKMFDIIKDDKGDDDE